MTVSGLSAFADVLTDGPTLTDLLDTYDLKATPRASDDQIAEVVRNLVAEFEWPCPAHTFAMLVYGGLSELMKQSLLHMEDPKLSWATTALRHALDVVRNAPEESFYDLRKAITVAFEHMERDADEVEDGS